MPGPDPTLESLNFHTAKNVKKTGKSKKREKKVKKYCEMLALYGGGDYLYLSIHKDKDNGTGTGRFRDLQL